MSVIPPTANTPEAALQRVVHFFEHLQPADLAHIAEVYTSDAQFKDPFNEVVGTTAIAQIFRHMFDHLEAPRFVITQSVQQGPQCFVTWDFLFAIRSVNAAQTHVIRGASHLVMREESGLWRIALHRDYWDAAEELYEKLPWVGGLMRWLKKRVTT